MSIDFSLIPTLTLAAMMLALGMELKVHDFREVLKMPGAFALGIGGQLILLPAVAFALAVILPIASATALGLILLAACPGGTTSNMFSSYARGDVALSISLTAVSGLAAPVTVPLIVGAGFLVITGEGKLDSQSVEGKTPVGVARIAQAQGVPVIAIAGALGDDYQRVYEHGIEAAFSIAPGPVDLSEAVERAPSLIADTVEAVLRARQTAR